MYFQLDPVASRHAFASVGLTYEQSAVKLVVRELKSGTVLL